MQTQVQDLTKLTYKHTHTNTHTHNMHVLLNSIDAMFLYSCMSI